MRITLEIDNDKYPFFLELLNHLIFVTDIEIKSGSDDEFDKEIKLTTTQEQKTEQK